MDNGSSSLVEMAEGRKESDNVVKTRFFIEHRKHQLFPFFFGTKSIISVSLSQLWVVI